MLNQLAARTTSESCASLSREVDSPVSSGVLSAFCILSPIVGKEKLTSAGCSPLTVKMPHPVSLHFSFTCEWLPWPAHADIRSETTTPSTEIRLTGSKATVAIWAPLSDYILTGHENGKVAKYDAKTGEEVEVVEGSHSREITDIQLSPDGTYFITCSRDRTARVSISIHYWTCNPFRYLTTQLWDVETLQEMKVYATQTELNSACITPGKPYVSQVLAHSTLWRSR